MSENTEDRELTAIASVLRQLRPKTEPINRSVLMYRAGRASVRGWLWPSATVISSAAALVLGIALWNRPVSPISFVTVPFTQNTMIAVAPPLPRVTNAPEDGAWARYLQMQEQVALHGLDGLPVSSGESEETPASLESLLKSL